MATTVEYKNLKKALYLALNKAMAIAITLHRFFLIVPTLFALEEESRRLAGFFILLAGESDWLDGGIARKNKEVSKLGILLDPLVDKAFVLSILSFFLIQHDRV